MISLLFECGGKRECDLPLTGSVDSSMMGECMMM